MRVMLIILNNYFHVVKETSANIFISCTNRFYKYILVFLIIFCSTNFRSTNVVKDKNISRKEYFKNFVNTNIVKIRWRGSVKRCGEGKLSDKVLSNALRRINYFRKLVGVDSVYLDPALNAKAQKAALIMQANSTLSHFPKEAWKCYSEEGAVAAKNSNIGYLDLDTRPNIGIVAGLIEDWGQENYYCGHRRWLLYSRAEEMGYGATDKLEVIYVITQFKNTAHEELPEYIAYPPAGYVPVNLVFPKWSFSIPDIHEVNFSMTNVNLQDSSGEDIPIKIFSLKENIGDPTITWEVSGLFSNYDIKYGLNELETKSIIDSPITVDLSDVIVDGKFKNFRYQVIIYKP